MNKRKGPVAARKLVWRMSEAAPKGEFVDSDKAAADAALSSAIAAAKAREVSHGSWLESSFELLNGADVREGPDTVPDDLFDELFPSNEGNLRPKP